MAKSFDVTTVGGATRDITFYTKEGLLIPNPDPLRQRLLGFEYGAKIGIQKAFFTFGGGAANAAVCFARLGLKVATVLRVGNDEDGRAVIKNLKKNKIYTEFIQIDKKAKTGFSFIVTFGPTREHTAFLYRGANDELRITNSELRNLRSKWFYIASLSGAGWRRIMDKIITQRVRLAWNPGARQLAVGLNGLKKYLAKTEILFVNKDEAIEIVTSLPKYKRMTINWLNKPANLFGVLVNYGPNILVITDGKRGAYAFDGKKIYYQKALSKRVVDTTGAGDSFCSSFTAGYILYHGNILKSLKLAAINSAYNLTMVGAQEPLLTREEAEKKMKY